MSAQAKALQAFSATYELYYKWLHLGSGTYNLQPTEDGQYRFSFESDMGFLIYFDKRKVNSTFTYQDDRLHPITYTHDREGTGEDYFEIIRFDKQQQLIDARFREDTISVPYDPGILDGLSVQLQLMLDVQGGKGDLQYRIFEEFGVIDRDFSYAGTEKLTINDVDYDCIVIQVARPEKHIKIKMWFARQLGYKPLQLVHYVKGKKQFNAVLSDFEFKDGTGPETNEHLSVAH